MGLVRIYSKNGCIYCDKTKNKFQTMGIKYELRDLSLLDKEQYSVEVNKLKDSTGQNTFPWIYIGEHFVGGYTELIELITNNKFYSILKSNNVDIELDDDF